MVGAENFIIVVETEIAAVVGRVVRLFVFFSFLILSFPHHSLFRKILDGLLFKRSQYHVTGNIITVPSGAYAGTLKE